MLGTALKALLAGSVLAGGAAPSAAQAGIYTCVDAQGRRHTSDRPILQCLDREQRVLNRDGSTRQLLGPSLSVEERAAAEARERQRQAERARQIEAGRRDRMLLARYPHEAEHQRTREAALADLRQEIRKCQLRLSELARERQALQAETEFFLGKPLPPKLRQALEHNEVAREMHKALLENQQSELSRINGLYDQELERLRGLWSSARAAPTSAAPARK